MRYQFKEEQSPQRPTETRVLVTWPGCGWWHKLGHVERLLDGRCEVWPVHGLHRDTSRLFASADEGLEWLKSLWRSRRMA